MTYEQMMYVGIGMGVVFLAVAIVVFFGLGVADAIGELSGLKARKRIAAIRNENGNSRKNPRKSGKAGLMGIFKRGTDKIDRDDETERIDSTDDTDSLDATERIGKTDSFDKTDRIGENSDGATERIADNKVTDERNVLSSEEERHGTDVREISSPEDAVTEKLSDSGYAVRADDTREQPGNIAAETTYLKKPVSGDDEQYMDQDFEIVTRYISIHTDEELI